MDVKFSDSKYTWWNSRINDEYTFDRLDRVLVNAKFYEIFPSIELQHQIIQGSDHTHICVICNSEVGDIVKPFVFLNFWCKHKNFLDIIRQHSLAGFIGDLFLELLAKLKRVKYGVKRNLGIFLFKLSLWWILLELKNLNLKLIPPLRIGLPSAKLKQN